jgi:uncharacterized phage protein (TIGR02218 family)
MQDWPDDLIAELALNPTTLCRLFRITPAFSPELLFTDADLDVTVSGELYRADHSFQPSAIENAIGGANSNLELTVLFTDTLIKYEDVMARRYQGATVKVYLASYGNPAAGKGIITSGRIGSFAVSSRLQGVMSIVGGSGKMDRTLTEVYQPTCRADFGDTRCGLNINDFSLAFTVASIVDDMIFMKASGGVDGRFNLGTLVWATGPNTGQAQEVAYSLATGAVGLFYPPGYPVTVGNTGTLYQGCAKTIAACTAYANVSNFRGEPYVPGDDYKQTV